MSFRSTDDETVVAVVGRFIIGAASFVGTVSEAEGRLPGNCICAICGFICPAVIALGGIIETGFIGLIEIGFNSIDFVDPGLEEIAKGCGTCIRLPVGVAIDGVATDGV